MILFPTSVGTGQLHLGDNRARKLFRSGKFIDHIQRYRLLLRSRKKDRRAILISHIRPLPIESGRIVHHKKTLKKFLGGHFLGIVLHLHYLSVPRAMPTNFLIRWIFCRPTRVAHLHIFYPGKLRKSLLHPPETARSKKNRFRARHLSRLLEIKHHRVNAVAQSSRLRPIWKNMPQMHLAPNTMHFRPTHPQSGIAFLPNILVRKGLEKTRPARPRIKFIPRLKKRQAAPRAEINPFLMIVVKNTAKSSLRPCRSPHPKLLHGQSHRPLFIRAHHLRHLSGRSRFSCLRQQPDRNLASLYSFVPCLRHAHNLPRKPPRRQPYSATQNHPSYPWKSHHYPNLTPTRFRIKAGDTSHPLPVPPNNSQPVSYPQDTSSPPTYPR